MSRFTVLTADDGNIEAYAALSRSNKLAYCQQHGYHFAFYQLNETPPDVSELDWLALSPCWRLVYGIMNELRTRPNNSWIFFSGADAVITDLKFKLDWIVDEWGWNCDLLITKDENGLNNNGFLIRVCDWSREYINKIWALRGQIFSIKGPDGHYHQWEEQGAFIKVLEEPGMLDRVVFIPQEYTNAYPPEVYGEQYKSPVLMAHFPGKKTAEREYFIKRALGLVQNTMLPQGFWIDRNGVVQRPQGQEEFA
jgi:hypothetical protein